MLAKILACERECQHIVHINHDHQLFLVVDTLIAIHASNSPLRVQRARTVSNLIEV